jgi:hypothetical protein
VVCWYLFCFQWVVFARRRGVAMQAPTPPQHGRATAAPPIAACCLLLVVEAVATTATATETFLDCTGCGRLWEAHSLFEAHRLWGTAPPPQATDAANDTTLQPLPEEFKNHESLSSLVLAVESFAKKKGFATRVNCGKSFNSQSDLDAIQELLSDVERETPHDERFLKMRYGVIECAQSGKKQERQSKVSPENQRQKGTHKCGCKWSIRFTVKNVGDPPKVNSFVMEHEGHQPSERTGAYLDREIPEEAKETINKMIKCLATTPSIQMYMNQNFPKANYTPKDISNYISKQRGDVQHEASDLLTELYEQQKSDPNMVIETKLGSNFELQVRVYLQLFSVYWNYLVYQMTK